MWKRSFIKNSFKGFEGQHKTKKLSSKRACIPVLTDTLKDILYDQSGGDYMVFISSREIRNNPALLWENDEVVLTVNGEPKAVVIKIDGDPKMVLDLIEKVKAQMAVEELRMFSLKKGLNKLLSDEIEKIIEEVRKEK